MGGCSSGGPRLERIGQGYHSAGTVKSVSVLSRFLVIIEECKHTISLINIMTEGAENWGQCPILPPNVMGDSVEVHCSVRTCQTFSPHYKRVDVP